MNTTTNAAGAAASFQAANMMNSVGVAGSGMTGVHGTGYGTDLSDPMGGHHHHHPDDLAMMDDMERAKHYKSNIIQDFNDRQSMYSSRVGGGGGGGGYKSRYDDGLYSDSKSMYGGGGGGYGADGKIYSDGGGSKSLYGGYNDRMSSSNLRRSRSIHAKLPPRRDPYDYLPDEPQTLLNDGPAGAPGTAAATAAGGGAMVGNKPDIMQSVGMDGSDLRR